MLFKILKKKKEEEEQDSKKDQYWNQGTLCRIRTYSFCVGKFQLPFSDPIPEQTHSH